MGEYDYFDLDTQLRGTFYQQASEIWQTMKLSRADITELKMLHYDILRLLQEIWPGVQIKLFGSIKTKLAFTNSDVDFFVELPAHYKTDPEDYFLSIYICVAYDNAFQVISSAPRTRIPVITLQHLDSSRYCDLTFSGSIAIETDKLLNFLLSIDSRAFKLAFLVKFWSKLYKLTVTKRLSNHTITLLVIFFLQMKKILPSVAALQENGQINMTEGWNTAFVPIIHEPNNTETLYQLLGKFFVFYSSFNFKYLVVSPYLGYPVKRQEFINFIRLPIEFSLYKTRVILGRESLALTSCWCIQDYFNHSRNCAVHLDSFELLRVEHCFNVAAACYTNYSSFEFLRVLISKANSIPSLPRSTSTTLQQYTLTDGQIPKAGWSWTFYFCILFCSFIFYTYLIKHPKV